MGLQVTWFVARISPLVKKTYRAVENLVSQNFRALCVS
jgi:hypothetical protein